MGNYEQKADSISGSSSFFRCGPKSFLSFLFGFLSADEVVTWAWAKTLFSQGSA